jgi:hypothetical protein
MKFSKSAVIISVVVIAGFIVVDLFVWSIPVLRFYFSSLNLLGVILVAIFGVAILLTIFFQWGGKGGKERS